MTGTPGTGASSSRTWLGVAALGLACLACCLPLITGFLATVGVVGSGLSVLLRPWWPATVTVGTAAVIAFVWLVRRRQRKRTALAETSSAAPACGSGCSCAEGKAVQHVQVQNV